MISNRQAHNVADFGERLAWRSPLNARIYTRAQLKTMGVEWVYDAVRTGFAEVHQGPAWIDADCSVIVIGGPDIAELAPLTVDDIESVEIYDLRSAPPPSTARPGRRAPCTAIPRSRPSIDRVPLTNTYIAEWANKTKKCTLVYVWLR